MMNPIKFIRDLKADRPDLSFEDMLITNQYNRERIQTLRIPIIALYLTFLGSSLWAAHVGNETMANTFLILSIVLVTGYGCLGLYVIKQGLKRLNQVLEAECAALSVASDEEQSE